MILVTLGTHELSFVRLLKELDNAIMELGWANDVMVQAGHTVYSSDRMQVKDFFTYEEMEQLIDESEFVITHAGTGSVISALRKNKKVIAAPRLKKYGEHNDDHQLQLTEVFETAGHILVWRDGEALATIMRNMEEFTPTPFLSGGERMVSILDTFIKEA